MGALVLPHEQLAMPRHECLTAMPTAGTQHLLTSEPGVPPASKWDWPFSKPASIQANIMVLRTHS